ncbi:MAG: penicillin-binding protein 1B [Gammaproteobacteria bacterium]|nr:penicillin-binding protein 1B [Gammaproteobacteria bacterium]
MHPLQQWLKQLDRKRAAIPHFWRWLLLIVTTIGFLTLWAYVAYLDSVVKAKFEGKRWAVPARVYARPLELYPGMNMTASQFVQELSSLGYYDAPTPKISGSYRRKGGAFFVITRPATFWDGKEPSIAFRAEFSDGVLNSLSRASGNEPLNLVRFDPMQIGSIYPAHNEDRILVKLSDVPPQLIKALLAIEDRDFYEHHGIAPRAMFRALFANLRAGGTVQGGSTITQQLVKNFFLTNERTLTRKINEIIMALELERRYGKAEILETYLNEIYLGQDGARSIHGFGLASQFYFGRPLNELHTEHIALLVALVKGPSFYDPRRHQQRSRQRRDLVVDALVSLGDITDKDAKRFKAADLGITKIAASGVTPFPAFLDLVRDQLKRDYREEDLTSEGLQIFTTLDPLVQRSADRAMVNQIHQIEKYKRLPQGQLQGAAVVVNVEGAEVLAVVGGRDPNFAGFNRARDAVRQIGSLVKPAVYLTALKNPQNYTPVTQIDDSAVSLKAGDGKQWTPENYDHQEHGPVPLYQALAHSYNLATARLGLAIGLPNIVDTLHALGVEREIDPYPSLLLGAASLTPLEVTQMYHTLANGGFLSPLRAINAVLTADGKPLQRFPLSVERAVDAASVYVVNTMLQAAVREGTGRSLYSMVPASLAVAGKTGTSNDLRDSWFAGFTHDRLAVTWLGMDNDQSSRLTGAEGALRVWGDLMSGISAQPGAWPVPDNAELVWIDPANNLRADSSCAGALQLGFIAGSAPANYSPCAGLGGAVDQTINWIKGIFQ